MDKKVKFNLWYVGIAFVLIMTLQGILGQRQQAQITTLSYSEFQSLLAQGRVADVVISENFIRGTFDEPLNGKTGFRTTRVEQEFAIRVVATNNRV